MWRHATIHCLGRACCAAALAAALLAVLGAPRALAQPRDGEMVRRELEATNELLQRAADVVRHSGNPRAGMELQMAVRTQEEAWAAFRAARWLLAHDKTLLARLLAQRAVNLARQQGDLEERARRILEDAHAKLERARDCAGEPPAEPALRLLGLAAARLEQAREALHEQKFQIAIDIGMQVQRMLDDLCSRRPMQRADELIDNVRRLLERAEHDMNGCDPGARAHLDRGREQLLRAEERLRSGNPMAAAHHAQQAKELVLRAMRLCERPPEEASVDRLLEDTGRYVLELAQQVRASGHPEATQLVDRAVEHLDRARGLRDRGRLRQALAEIRVARNLARRAAQLAGIRSF